VVGLCGENLLIAYQHVLGGVGSAASEEYQINKDSTDHLGTDHVDKRLDEIEIRRNPSLSSMIIS
jgi:hypothetical protein